MKAKKREEFSVTQHQNEKVDNKIELVSCPVKEIACKQILLEFNKKYSESNHYRIEKDFPRSIDSLKYAYDRTKDLIHHPCSSCAHFYRSTIVESLQIIHEELGMMSKGFLGNNKYKVSLLKVTNMLNELQPKR